MSTPGSCSAATCGWSLPPPPRSYATSRVAWSGIPPARRTPHDPRSGRTVMPCDFLLATWEGGGTVPPVLTVARRLLARGHRVRVMLDSCACADVEAAGAEFVAWSRAPSRPDRSSASDPARDWEAVSPPEKFARLRDAVMTGPALAYAQDTLAELARRQADLVVSSEMLLGVMAAAEAAKRPLAVLSTNVSCSRCPASRRWVRASCPRGTRPNGNSTPTSPVR